MLVPHSTLVKCLGGDLSNVGWQRHAQRLLGVPDDIWPIVLKWMQRLPDKEKSTKIVNGFLRTAIECDAAIENIQWWDIDQHKRHLLCVVRRRKQREWHLSPWHLRTRLRNLLGGHLPRLRTHFPGDAVPVRVLLMWKKRPGTERDKRMAQHIPGHASWEYDAALNDFRFSIEGETYDHVLEAFRRWLNNQLETLPGGEKYTPRAA